jgi:uncharacterized flavoprotein (TIGR03862 family)
MSSNHPPIHSVAIIGGGPAGLMAAEVLLKAGLQVDLYDAMPSVGRKFLLAGKGGLNLTHAEPYRDFVSRYGARQAEIAPLLDAFGPQALRRWVHELGVETFVGSSGRVFPTEMKAAPLLRSWLHRLRSTGLQLHVRHRWLGWDNSGRLRFATPGGEHLVEADAVLLALGGGSWARLGSDGQWVTLLEQRGVNIARLRPANCGFEVAWSEHFRNRFAGEPVKNVALSTDSSDGLYGERRGELMITQHGIEGGLIYAFAAPLRDAIEERGSAVIHLDLAPDRSLERLQADLAQPRGKLSFANYLRKRAAFDGVKAGLLRECLPPEVLTTPALLAAAIKSLPLTLNATRPIDEAISTAGGVPFEALDEKLMLRSLPGIFCAGEMLDWEAPTGGYLLTACFASGRAAGQGVLAWLEKKQRD